MDAYILIPEWLMEVQIHQPNLQLRRPTASENKNTELNEIIIMFCKNIKQAFIHVVPSLS